MTRPRRSGILCAVLATALTSGCGAADDWVVKPSDPTWGAGSDTTDVEVVTMARELTVKLNETQVQILEVATQRAIDGHPDPWSGPGLQQLQSINSALETWLSPPDILPYGVVVILQTPTKQGYGRAGLSQEDVGDQAKREAALQAAYDDALAQVTGN